MEYIFHSHTNEVSWSVQNNLSVKTASHRNHYIDLLRKSIYGSYMTWVPIGSYSRTYFSIEVIKTPQRHPNIRKAFYILTIPKVKLNLALKMIRTPKRFSKLSIMVRSKMSSSIKNCTMYKPVHRLAKQVSVLVFTWRGIYWNVPLDRHYYRHYSHTIIQILLLI